MVECLACGFGILGRWRRIQLRREVSKFLLLLGLEVLSFLLLVGQRLAFGCSVLEFQLLAVGFPFLGVIDLVRSAAKAHELLVNLSAFLLGERPPGLCLGCCSVLCSEI